MRKIYSFIIAALISMLGFVGAAQAQSLDEMLANPQVDDILVARLDHFSEGFDSAAFGMLRVIEVDGKKIVAVTEDAAWPGSPDGAYEELDGDFSSIGWDFSEEITIERSKLADLKMSDIILRGRRLSEREIQDYLE